jgi:transposase-like protein
MLPVRCMFRIKKRSCPSGACSGSRSDPARQVHVQDQEAILPVRCMFRIKNSMKFMVFKDREAVAKGLKTIYQASTLEEAEGNLQAFSAAWDAKYPTISDSWRRNWARVTPFLAYPPAMRRVVYTTNAVESLNSQLRRAVRNRGSFPSEGSALKVLFLAVSRAIKKWFWLPVKNWRRPRPVRCRCRVKTGGVILVCD